MKSQKLYVECHFFGDKSAVIWEKIKVKKVENIVSDKLERCLK